MSQHNFIGLILVVFCIFWGVETMAPIKRHRIDWDNIPIIIVSADKDNPNPLNPCSRMTPKQREADIVSICGRIWARTMKENINVKV